VRRNVSVEVHCKTERLAFTRMSVNAMRQPFSKLGIAFAGAYVALAVLLLAYSWSQTDDASGGVIVAQVPIALQGALLESLGFGSLLEHLTWPMAYLVLGLPTVAILYAIGALIQRVLPRGA
jgi:hypothetical protein